MDFENSLKRSLMVVNEGYQNARNDVDRLLSSLAEAVSKIAGEQFVLGVDEFSSDVKGTNLRINLDTDFTDMNADIVDIAFIRIPAKGYPIQHGPLLKATKTMMVQTHIADAEELAKFFLDMIENPDSPLVQAIGFALRKKSS